MGRHARTYSLVLPISGEALRRSEAVLELENELKASRFAEKIAWSLLDRRQDKLHATICNSLTVGEQTPPTLDASHRRETGDRR
jgi:hypothetical protein